MSRMLFLFQSLPYDGPRTKDGIDACLVASAFGQEVSVLFLGDAVFQLIAPQAGATINRKSIDKLIKAFDLYDIKNIFADKTAFASRNIEPNSLAVAATLLEQHQIQLTLKQHDIILSF